MYILPVSSFLTFVYYQTCEYDILKNNSPIVTQIGTRGPRGKGTKRSTLGVMTSKVKVT